MIRRIFIKDLTLLWPLAALVLAIQLGFEWSLYKAGFVGGNPVYGELVRLLLVPWFIGIAALSIAVVHEDPVPGADQDWLIRPIPRTDLLLAKMSFVVLVILLPMLAINVAQELALGFPAVPSIATALYKEFFLFVSFMVPVIAVAAATRNIPELLVLLAGLVVLYAISLLLSAILFGDSRCPTCDTGYSWIQHQLQHVGVLGGSVAILVLQYYRRRTAASRWVMGAGVVALVFLQIPWNAAFASHIWLMGNKGSAPAAIRVATAAAVWTSNPGGARAAARPDLARRATQALIHGDVDVAIQNMKRFSRPEDAPVGLTVPIAISGTAADEFVMADRWVVSLVDAGGHVLYRETQVSHEPVPLKQQAVQIPSAALRRLGPRPASLVIDYSLTLMGATAEHKMRAVDGELREPDLGVCQSSSNSTGVHIRCRQIGLASSCYTATLFGPAAQRNPEVVNCSFDYRPYIPSPVNIITFSAVDLPTLDPSGLAHYAIDIADLPRSYVVLTAYAARGHFQRTVVSPLPPSE
jgi:hypothetical protein